MVFKTLDIRQGRTVVPKGMVNKQSEPYHCPSSLPRERFQATKQGGETQVELRDLPELRRCSRDFRKAEAARVYNVQYWEGKHCTEKEHARDLQGDPSSIQLSSS